ncbi:hypothetical protein F4775DRAFT_448460 [Biscogniauxia sp. FL1348]|nr:hypothetical protein F4775DRAFT_448460 [Biscogniauxia sp. FL1348]
MEYFLSIAPFICKNHFCFGLLFISFIFSLPPLTQRATKLIIASQLISNCVATSVMWQGCLTALGYPYTG